MVCKEIILPVEMARFLNKLLSSHLLTLQVSTQKQVIALNFNYIWITELSTCFLHREE
jgi:hypothetical protein